MGWLEEIAQQVELTPRQVQMIWYRGQIGVNGGDRKGDKNAPEYFTETGLTEKGQKIYKNAEEARRMSISSSLKEMIAEF